MALNSRQRRAYKDTCNLWQPSYTINGTSKLQTGTTYTLAASDVPCHFESRQSVEGPSVFGAVEGDDLYSRDKIHFAIDVTIDSGWIVKKTTVDRNGDNAPDYGRFWVVSGQPQSIPARGGRRANKIIVQAVQEQTAPDGVS